MRTVDAQAPGSLVRDLETLCQYELLNVVTVL